MSVSNPVAGSVPREETLGRISLVVRLVTLAVIIVPLLGLVAAAVFL